MEVIGSTYVLLYNHGSQVSVGAGGWEESYIQRPLSVM